MKKITIISVGDFKEDYLRKAAAEYRKRLSGFCTLTETVLREVPDGRSDAMQTAALEKEAGEILAKLPRMAWKAALCIEGEQMKSRELALKTEEAFLRYPEAVFVIGSSHGLSDKVKDACDIKISMSEMTFPHQLAKIMLMEQLYRSFCISENRKYHK